MSVKFDNILKEYKKTIIYLLKIYKDKTLIDVLKLVSVIRKITDKKKKAEALLDIKKLYYKEVLKKPIEVNLGKRIGLTNTFLKLRLKKNNGIIYNLEKGNKQRQRVVNFELISKDNLKRYRSLFFYALDKKNPVSKKLKKLYRLTKYEKFFIWPFLITIKIKVIIIKNIFFRNFFIIKKNENLWLEWIELKNQYRSGEVLLNRINILNANMLNNYFIKNNLFSYSKINILDNAKKYKNDILNLYLYDIFLKKNINNLFSFLKIIKRSKIKIKENLFNNLLKTLIFFFKSKKNIKIYNNNRLNFYFWSKNNKVFNKTVNTKKNNFFNYKNYIKRYAKRSIINYSFFLRLYTLYFFWFLFFFNKIFYYFNKILFNFWFRFFYFLHSSLNFNSKLFFSFNKLYKNIYFKIKNVNFYFEFENIFINYLDNIKNIFFNNIKYIFFNKKYNIFIKDFILKKIFFIFKNYFFSNVYYFYNSFLKNIINKSFKLENNLFDLLYTGNYKYNNIYNEKYFIVNGYICKKFNSKYQTTKKRKSKLNAIELINFEELEEKRKRTLFLY